MAISELYAGPGLRWGLLLEDHPGSWATFETKTGDELNIPDVLGGGDRLYCVATIHFPDGTGRLPVTGFKVIPANPEPPNTPNKDGHLSDLWQTLCTKALGRAANRAGYPANLPDLKALVVWRQRNHEIAALDSGLATVALKAADPGAALDGAGQGTDESSDGDDAPGHVDADGVETAEVVDPDDSPDPGDADLTLVPASQESKAKLRECINGLGPRSSELTRWARDEGMRVTNPKTEAEAQRMIAQAEAMLAGDPDETPVDELPVDPATLEAPTAEDIAELVIGLTDDERRAYVAFLESIGIDPQSGPEDWAVERLVEVMGWLDTDDPDEGAES